MRRRCILYVYLVALALSRLVRLSVPEAGPEGQPAVELAALVGATGERADAPVRLAYREWGNDDQPPAVLLLHGELHRR